MGALAQSGRGGSLLGDGLREELSASNSDVVVRCSFGGARLVTVGEVREWPNGRGAGGWPGELREVPDEGPGVALI